VAARLLPDRDVLTLESGLAAVTVQGWELPLSAAGANRSEKHRIRFRPHSASGHDHAQVPTWN
jgi:hypothetical protein